MALVASFPLTLLSPHAEWDKPPGATRQVGASQFLREDQGLLIGTVVAKLLGSQITET